MVMKASWWMHSASGVMRLSKPAKTIGVRANNAINDMVRVNRPLESALPASAAEGNAILLINLCSDVGTYRLHSSTRILYAPLRLSIMQLLRLHGELKRAADVRQRA